MGMSKFDVLDTAEEVLLEWAEFREEHGLTDDVVAEGNRIIAEEKAKKGS